MDNHRHFGHFMVAGLFRTQDIPAFPTNRRLDSYSDRDRRHLDHLAFVRGYVTLTCAAHLGNQDDFVKQSGVSQNQLSPDDTMQTQTPGSLVQYGYACQSG